MTKEQVKELLNILNNNYNNFINENNYESILTTWLNELCQYDYNDVLERTKELLSKSEFQMKQPTLYHIVAPLTKVNDKVDFTKMVFYCPRCKKAFNDEIIMDKHTDRCRSIDYVIRETKKWFNKDITRKELFQMNEKEFEERYDKLLRYIMEHTTNEEEKIRISYIFNPPSQEETKKFLNI